MKISNFEKVALENVFNKEYTCRDLLDIKFLVNLISQIRELLITSIVFTKFMLGLILTRSVFNNGLLKILKHIHLKVPTILIKC